MTQPKNIIKSGISFLQSNEENNIDTRIKTLSHASLPAVNNSSKIQNKLLSSSKKDLLLLKIKKEDQSINETKVYI